MKLSRQFFLPMAAVSLCTSLTGCMQSDAPTVELALTTKSSPGAPGAESTWAYSGKTGIGTSYEQYTNSASGARVYGDKAATGTVSKVWFSLAQGVITETMFGLIHEAQLKDIQVLVTGKDFLDVEKDDTESTIEYLHVDDEGRPLSLAYKVTTRDKEDRYVIEKHVFTDPDHNSLYVRLKFKSLSEGLRAYLRVNPHMNNTGGGDSASANLSALEASDSGVHMSLQASKAFVAASAGFVGVSDGLADLQANGKMDWQYSNTGSTPGNVAMTAQLPLAEDGSLELDFTVGFARSAEQSSATASASLQRGYDKVLAQYNGRGDAIGWEDYLGSLPELARLSKTATDQGRLLHTSAMVLKAQEDKTHAGALIASLSNPWGDAKPATQSQTGYKAVWPRDFYQCAMALLALGDTQTPLVSFEYLEQVQVRAETEGYKGTPGWFLQKTHVDGKIEWVGVQLDQTAMPIMLGWKLWQAGLLSDERLQYWYHAMLKPAADFLVHGGPVKLDWNDTTIVPLETQQERWEEQRGYSPSTSAAIISGLVTAADIARMANDMVSAELYLNAADSYSADLEKAMFTQAGKLQSAEFQASGETGTTNGQYYLRLSQNKNPNDDGTLIENNGRPSLSEQLILDGGFLELTRYGVRAANDPHILDTLEEYDDTGLVDDLKVKYEFTFAGEEGVFPGWRRYGNDGYGEDAISGLAYSAPGVHTPGQRGRVWPFFTGERGHYELARRGNSADTIDDLRATYVKGMELFANKGMMLPEQVWDGIGENGKYQYTRGEGTNSATPLAWTHAEYVKLLRSLNDGAVWDRYSIVEERYSKPSE